MTYFVYIIQSESLGIFYKGISLQPQRRLWEHNNNLSRYTSGKGPWRLVFLEVQPSKAAALKREKQLKRANSEYLQRVISEYQKQIDT